jgi:hypothetical protein
VTLDRGRQERPEPSAAGRDELVRALGRTGVALAERRERPPAGKRAEDRREPGAGRVHRPALLDGVPGRKPPFLRHPPEELAALRALDRDRPKAAPAIPREEERGARAAEAAVGVVEERDAAQERAVTRSRGFGSGVRSGSTRSRTCS